MSDGNADVAVSAGQASTGRERCVRWLRREWPLVLVLLISAVLLLSRLDLHLFWADEAITAFYSRSIIGRGGGAPLAWDGRNLLAYGGGTSLDDHLRPTAYPMLQFYAAAPFFAVLKSNPTIAGRLPSALLALVTVWMAYAFVLRRTQDRTAALAAALFVGASVAYLLFARQCRYYALTAFLSLALLMLYPRLRERKLGPWVLFTLCACLLFHAHFLVAATFLGAFAVAWLLVDRDRPVFLPLAAAGVVTIVLSGLYWFLDVRGPSAGGEPAAPTGWQDRLVLLGWYLRDANRAMILPVLLLPLALYAALRREGTRWTFDRFPIFLLIIIAVQVVLTALLSEETPSRTRAVQADVRYLANLLPLTAVLLGLVAARLWSWRRPVAVAFIAVALLTNLLTLDLARFRAHLAGYVYEMTHPYFTSTEKVINFLDARARKDDLVLIEPGYQRDPLIFYLGDRLRFCAVLPAEGEASARQRALLPPYVYSADVVPDWVITFGMRRIRTDIDAQLIPRRMPAQKWIIDAHWQDQSRPELLWHKFEPLPFWEPEDRIFVNHLGKPIQP